MLLRDRESRSCGVVIFDSVLSRNSEPITYISHSFNLSAFLYNPNAARSLECGPSLFCRENIVLESRRVRSAVGNLPPIGLAILAGAAAFCAYACMYAFRKPFSVAKFSDSPEVFGIDFKSVLYISQVIGYALSKFLGIKFVSEASSGGRAKMILGLIFCSEIALLLFASVETSWRYVFLFFNGLPLGMIWGLVFSYLEGRRFTEIMGLILCGSFTFASAIVKDVGKRLLANGVSEFWMPFATGLCFAIPLVVFVWLLEQVPPPSDDDRQHRTDRVPMLNRDRYQIFVRFAIGIVTLTFVYTLLTAYRDFRDTFMQDIMDNIRDTENSEFSFSYIETWVSVSVLCCLLPIAWIKSNLTAFIVNHVFIIGGFLAAGIAVVLFQNEMISDVTLMIMTGFATYIAYIPFNCILFERLIAVFRQPSNVGFFIYIADAFGYCGSIADLVYKNFGAKDLSWLEFFYGFSFALAVVGGIGTLGSLVYFLTKYRTQTSNEQ